ncbi:hypothetical protein R3P38DRAFT_3445035 [Favolaschia claudopus]|uniref:Uncharacterized protein n=1 Tax=Favolaschia claudopus TaxID=2862362 RepID=A0AAV9ZNU7_9AGAR
MSAAPAPALALVLPRAAEPRQGPGQMLAIQPSDFMYIDASASALPSDSKQNARIRRRYLQLLLGASSLLLSSPQLVHGFTIHRLIDTYAACPGAKLESSWILRDPLPPPAAFNSHWLSFRSLYTTGTLQEYDDLDALRLLPTYKSTLSFFSSSICPKQGGVIFDLSGNNDLGTRCHSPLPLRIRPPIPSLASPSSSSRPLPFFPQPHPITPICACHGDILHLTSSSSNSIRLDVLSISYDLSLRLRGAAAMDAADNGCGLEYEDCANPPPPRYSIRRQTRASRSCVGPSPPLFPPSPPLLLPACKPESTPARTNMHTERTAKADSARDDDVWSRTLAPIATPSAVSSPSSRRRLRTPPCRLALGRRDASPVCLAIGCSPVCLASPRRPRFSRLRSPPSAPSSLPSPRSLWRRRHRRSPSTLLALAAAGTPSYSRSCVSSSIPLALETPRAGAGSFVFVSVVTPCRHSPPRLAFAFATAASAPCFRGSVSPTRIRTETH